MKLRSVNLGIKIIDNLDSQLFSKKKFILYYLYVTNNTQSLNIFLDKWHYKQYIFHLMCIIFCAMAKP